MCCWCVQYHNVFALVSELGIEWPFTEWTTSGFWTPDGLSTEAPVFSQLPRLPTLLGQFVHTNALFRHGTPGHCWGLKSGTRVGRVCPSQGQPCEHPLQPRLLLAPRACVARVHIFRGQCSAPVPVGSSALQVRSKGGKHRAWCLHVRIQLVLFGIQNRTLVPYVYRKLPLVDRLTMLPLLYSIVDYDSDEATYRRYDAMSARELFRQCGVSTRLYEEFLKPLLLVGLFAPPEELSAGAVIGCLYFYGALLRSPRDCVQPGMASLSPSRGLRIVAAWALNDTMAD
jgi:uncharacterized protein with NAD-binding domain and iron-sulfur cluster